MSETLVHRGPDDFGYLLLDTRDGEFQLRLEGFASQPWDVCLGNRRLSRGCSLGKCVDRPVVSTPSSAGCRWNSGSGCSWTARG